LETVERMVELDPIRTFPKRGAAQIAELVGASGYRIEIDGGSFESDPAPGGAPAVSIDLVVGGEKVGALALHGMLSEEERQLARWAGRLLAKSLRYAQRLDGNNSQRSVEDVRAMLEKTPLTPRERDVVGRLLSGASTRQISESTGLTVATVNTYLKRIFAKLGVHSRVELVARVTGTRGVIPSEPKSDDAPSP
jgi:DNA-binding CsgD family transcriptional regulator